MRSRINGILKVHEEKFMIVGLVLLLSLMTNLGFFFELLSLLGHVLNDYNN